MGTNVKIAVIAAVVCYALLMAANRWDLPGVAPKE